jgi:CRISPR-associated endonuclease/helicase Cas3
MKLADLEHEHIKASIFSQGNHSSLWWQHDVTWSGELQRRTKFRNSPPTTDYFLIKDDEFSRATFRIFENNGYDSVVEKHFKRSTTFLTNRIMAWINTDPDVILMELAERLEEDVLHVSKRYSQISLRASNENDSPWSYDNIFGIFRQSSDCLHGSKI